LKEWQRSPGWNWPGKNRRSLDEIGIDHLVNTCLCWWAKEQSLSPIFRSIDPELVDASMNVLATGAMHQRCKWSSITDSISRDQWRTGRQ
jgi:hypothetical protein